MSEHEVQTEPWLRVDAKMLVVCMLLLGASAGWLILTRPVHHIEGDFMVREDRRVSDEWLAEQLQNPIAEQRARAFLALARIEGRVALDPLIAALKDPAPSVRANAAFSVGEILDVRGASPQPSAAAAEALVAVLLDDDRRVVSRAVEALGKMGRHEASAAITECAAPIVVIMTALIRMQARDQADFVTEYLESDDQDSRWAAALALGELALERTPLVDERLLALLTDRNDFVRAAAIRAAAVLYTNQANLPEGSVDAIGQSLEHRDIKLRYEAERALAIINGEAVFSPVPSSEPLLTPRQTPAGVETLFSDNDYQPIARTIGRHLVIATSIGDIEIELDYERAPLTAEYFRRRAMEGALDGVTFQAVSPNGYAVANGRLGWIPTEMNPEPFLRGSLGLLRAKNASSPGEFFISLTALPLADSRYVNFGRLVSGDQLIDLIRTETVIQSVRPLR